MTLKVLAVTFWALSAILIALGITWSVAVGFLKALWYFVDL